MPRLNLTEVTRNLADAKVGQCIDCGTLWNDEDLGPRCQRCEDYNEDMDTSYLDSLGYLEDLDRDEEYYRELEADYEQERERAEQLDDLPDDVADDVTWDWDDDPWDPWEAMNYNHERVAA